MLTVQWIKCGQPISHWCNLLTVNLEDVKTTGVYVIWHGGEKANVVRVGQGDIKDRLTKHRADKDILAYKEFGLYVTWASVRSEYLDGVEAYLAACYSPLVGERFPNVGQIAVNLPA